MLFVLFVLSCIHSSTTRQKVEALVAVAKASRIKEKPAAKYSDDVDGLINSIFEGVPEDFTILTHCYIGPCAVWHDLNDACSDFAAFVADNGKYRLREIKPKFRESHTRVMMAIADAARDLCPWFSKVEDLAVSIEHRKDWLEAYVAYLRSHCEFQEFILNHSPDNVSAKSVSGPLAEEMVILMRWQSRATHVCERLLSHSANEWIKKSTDPSLPGRLIRAYHRADIKVLEMLVSSRKNKRATGDRLILIFCILKSLDVSVRSFVRHWSGRLQRLWSERFYAMEELIRMWRRTSRSRGKSWDSMVKLQLLSIDKFFIFQAELDRAS